MPVRVSRSQRRGPGRTQQAPRRRVVAVTVSLLGIANRQLLPIKGVGILRNDPDNVVVAWGPCGVFKARISLKLPGVLR